MSCHITPGFEAWISSRLFRGIEYVLSHSQKMIFPLSYLWILKFTQSIFHVASIPASLQRAQAILQKSQFHTSFHTHFKVSGRSASHTFIVKSFPSITTKGVSPGNAEIDISLQSGKEKVLTEFLWSSKILWNSAKSWFQIAVSSLSAKTHMWFSSSRNQVDTVIVPANIPSNQSLLRAVPQIDMFHLSSCFRIILLPIIFPASHPANIPHQSWVRLTQSAQLGIHIVSAILSRCAYNIRSKADEPYIFNISSSSGESGDSVEENKAELIYEPKYIDHW